MPAINPYEIGSYQEVWPRFYLFLFRMMNSLDKEDLFPAISVANTFT
ncbi:MAG: hypothetical protein ACD_39C00380G0001, partial [uncultured bacterium]